MFSSRVPDDLQTNRFSRALAAARRRGESLIDLTETNPTRCGFQYDPRMLAPLASPAALEYRPEPFGAPGARAAVSRDYARRGLALAPSRIVLTASTSEAYSLLFKLLCDPSGEAVAIPVPGYPLFDHLTRLDGVAAYPYRLEYHGQWTIDACAIDREWRAGTRAVLAVSPANPTGSVLTGQELTTIARICAARGAALILDEVFADYPLSDGVEMSPALSDTGTLVFRLGGLSKSAGLPQVKLGWIGVEGPDDLVSGALARLELICDTYLSVSTPVQVAAADLLEAGQHVRRQILDRVRANHAQLRAAAAARPAVDVLASAGGWSAVLRVPARAPEETLVLDLLDRDHVVAHPGFFFDFPGEAYLVVSLLPPADRFREGIARMLERVDA